jgi:hypothetical protein
MTASEDTDKEDNLVGEVYGPNDSDSNEDRNKQENTQKETAEEKVEKRRYSAYKYSNKGKDILHEAVIVAGLPAFLNYKNDEIKAVSSIEEPSRIIKPPNQEEYPYEAYEFENMEEVYSYKERAKQETIDSLYVRSKSIIKKYNDQDDHKLVLLSADIVWSYFQDKFSTTHYDCVIGDNGSGKSTIGDTFVSVGYRPVAMTDPSAANLFRVLGTLESGQCTIVADEAERIDQSSEIMGTLKTGYHIKGKVPKINLNISKQEFYWTYCFKIIISERLPNQGKAKGVLDRMFIFDCYNGKPTFDIKEILNPAGNKRRQKLLDEILDFRKLMLVYRLTHFSDPIQDIEIGFDGRDKELCKPTIQLFYNAKSQKEIEAAFQKFLNSKSQRKQNTIEAALFPIIINLVSLYGKEVRASQIWEMITEGDVIGGKYDPTRPNEYQTSDYGTIYQNTITNIICDKFGADRKRKNNGTLLVFDNEKLLKVGNAYNLKSTIQTKLSDCEDNNSSESSEGCESSRVNSCTAIQVYHGFDNDKIEIFRNDGKTITAKIASNVVNITNNKDHKAATDTKLLNAYLPELSQPSLLSLSISFVCISIEGGL